MSPSQEFPLPVDPARLVRAVFVSRPNRFIVLAQGPDGAAVEAHMPNPGRLRELLLPGARLLLAPPPAETPERRPTVVAVMRGKRPVLLHTQWNNRVARWLLDRRLVPGWEDQEVVRAEVPVGKSRFDFLLRGPQGEMLVEVKSCTLFGGNCAMFPDAVTGRGRRHLEELAELASPRPPGAGMSLKKALLFPGNANLPIGLPKRANQEIGVPRGGRLPRENPHFISRTGRRCAVLFLVHDAEVSWFSPDYHTDPAFSEALCAVREQVRVVPLALSWNARMELDRSRIRELPVPWGHVAREQGDRGAYWLILRLDRPKTVETGALGALTFPAGCWVYVGSAMRGLRARMARHLRRGRARHWHADYLRDAADGAEVLALRSAERRECEIARALGGVLQPGPKGFGCGDCACETHLFFSREHPLDRPEVHGILERFRMTVPDGAE